MNKWLSISAFLFYFFIFSLLAFAILDSIFHFLVFVSDPSGGSELVPKDTVAMRAQAIFNIIGWGFIASIVNAVFYVGVSTVIDLDSRERIVKYEHHNKLVSIIKDKLRGRHREYCLCWQKCKFFIPEDREKNCSIANKLFSICVEDDVTTPVWECSKYERKNLMEKKNVEEK